MNTDDTIATIDGALDDWDATKRALRVAEWVTAAGLSPLTAWQLDVLRGIGRAR